MKKPLFAFLLVLSFVFLLPHSAAARIQLPDWFNRLWDRVSLPGQRATVGETVPSQPLPGSAGVSFPPSAATGDGNGCPGGQVPAGTNGQTLRCDGNKWVADSNIVNSGQQVAIGGTGSNSATLAVGDVDGGGAIWATEWSSNNTAIRGDALSGTGITGLTTSGKAVEATVYGGGSGYGFYQSGPNAKNYFEGNVGIGTTNPPEKLSVNGGVRVATTAGDIFMVHPGTGKVGIKTATPDYQLDVRGAVVSQDGVVKNTLSYGSGFGAVGTLSNHPLQLWSNNAARVTIGTAGNVGIGETNPTVKLDVNGQIKIRGGNPGANRVLTSDASGLASWETPAGGGVSGTQNRVAKFTGANTIGNSSITDDGSTVTMTKPLNMSGQGISNLRGIGAPENQNLDIAYGQPNDIYFKTGATAGKVVIGGTGLEVDKIFNLKIISAPTNNVVIAAPSLDVTGGANVVGNVAAGSLTTPGATACPTGWSCQVRTYDLAAESGKFYGGLEVAKTLKLQSTNLPACDASTRGTLAFVAGSGATNDQLYFCMRRDGVFKWLGG